MPFTIANDRGGKILKLEGSVTIQEAQDLTARLLESLEEGAPIGVDTAALEKIDTCILQMLCSLRKTVSTVSFDDPSAAFVAAVNRRGLRRQLLGGEPEAAR